MPINIKVLKALHGDSIILTFGNEKKDYILIDGGIGKFCIRELEKFCDELRTNEEKISLLILTHIDDDHINGILKLFSRGILDKDIVERMFFNYGVFLDNKLKIYRGKGEDIFLKDPSTKISWNQGTALSAYLSEQSFQYEEITKSLDRHSVGDSNITILSPSIDSLEKFNRQWCIEKEKETKISSESDYEVSIEELSRRKFVGNTSISNQSSIAFIFEYAGSRILMLGDASAHEVEKSLVELGYSEGNQLKVDLCKISHHASKHNTSNSLIKKIDCENFIISTNQTSTGRPSKECLSRIIINVNRPVNFYCNYKLDANRIFTSEEFERYQMNFITIDEEGINLGV